MSHSHGRFQTLKALRWLHLSLTENAHVVTMFKAYTSSSLVFWEIDGRKAELTSGEMCFCDALLALYLYVPHPHA